MEMDSAIREKSASLLHCMFLVRVLPEVDDLCQAVQDHGAVPGRNMSRQQGKVKPLMQKGINDNKSSILLVLLCSDEGLKLIP